MFQISKDSIYYLSTPMKFKKGLDYYKGNRIKSVSFNEELLLFDASVLGTRTYNVQVQFNKQGNLRNYSCSCPDNVKNESCCKHITAVLLLIKSKDEQGFFNSASHKKAAKEIFDFFSGKSSNMKSLVNVEYTLELYSRSRAAYLRRGPAAVLSLRLGTDRMYIVRNVGELLDCLKNEKELVYGKGFSFDPDVHKFSEPDELIISYLTEMWQNENLIDYMNGENKKSIFKDKEIFLSDGALKRLLVLLQDSTFKVVLDGETHQNVTIHSTDIPVNFMLTKNSSTVDLIIDTTYPLHMVTADCEYFLYNKSIYRVSKHQREYLKPFVQYVQKENNNKISFMDNDKERLFTELIPYMEKAGNVLIDDELQAIVEKPEFEPEIYLDRLEDIITADVRFKYGERVINPFAPDRNRSPFDKILIRDLEAEGSILDILAETECKVSGNRVYLDEEEKIFDFVNSVIPKLQEHSQVFYSESFKALSFKRLPSFSGFLRLNSINGLLEFNFNIEGVERNELASIFESIRQKKKYFRLKDGAFLPLDAQRLVNMAEILEQLDLSSSDIEKEFIQLPKYRALYIDNILKESGMKFFERNAALKELIHDIQDPAETEYKVPGGIRGTLRDYQKLGFKWMKTLSHYGLGGILADDMGLGKTLQVITLLELDKQLAGEHRPSLVIVPTSLIYNWCAEVQKFAPDLTFTAVTGSKPERQELIREGVKTDLIITSYALIRRDIEDYLNYNFSYCILDEAQHIKNPLSQAAKAVKQLSSEHRLALTGTPMENNLTELWSVFDFILPGYLGSHTRFSQRFEVPISKGDNTCLESLGRQLRPFILRRLKQDVLKELPEKIEHVIEAELTQEQKKLYMAYLEQARGELFSEIKERGFEKSQIKILSVLTRLRQLCCHPSLFVEDYTGDSGKLQLLKEVVEDSLNAGHRILLFSQFTSMLAIIKNWLEEVGVRYLYLDGSTPAGERMRLVRSFNEGDGSIFLLSLKSGGTGLNLTGADTVIHYDPWWNPAVDDQATDRAYRIGQTKTVHVMKLVTHGTIEEKILTLKERKKQLVDAVIQSGETLLTKMSQQELLELFEM